MARTTRSAPDKRSGKETRYTKGGPDSGRRWKRTETWGFPMRGVVNNIDPSQVAGVGVRGSCRIELRIQRPEYGLNLLTILPYKSPSAGRNTRRPQAPRRRQLPIEGQIASCRQQLLSIGARSIIYLLFCNYYLNAAPAAGGIQDYSIKVCTYLQ
ncbi:hypothetical protein BJX76DRAFT_2662 [Aspergillus varians]